MLLSATENRHHRAGLTGGFEATLRGSIFPLTPRIL
jgi:hypothetical protein